MIVTPSHVYSLTLRIEGISDSWELLDTVYELSDVENSIMSGKYDKYLLICKCYYIEITDFAFNKMVVARYSVNAGIDKENNCFKLQRNFIKYVDFV